MALGSYDSNGIWQYGLDDEFADPAEMLNKGMASVSTVVGDLQDLVEDPQAPQPVTFASGVTDFAGWEATTYRLNELGWAEIVGQMNISAGSSVGQTLFTLPTGYRPAAKIARSVVNNSASSAAHAGVEIDTAGVVTIRNAGVTHVNLGRIEFRPA